MPVSPVWSSDSARLCVWVSLGVGTAVCPVLVSSAGHLGRAELVSGHPGKPVEFQSLAFRYQNFLKLDMSWNFLCASWVSLPLTMGLKKPERPRS